MKLELFFVIPDAAQRRSGIQMQARSLFLDSGFAPPKSAIADLGIIECRPEIGGAPE
jgi:hypothetical protein